MKTGLRSEPQCQIPWGGWLAVAFVATALGLEIVSVSSAQPQESFISYACGAPNDFDSGGISWASDFSIAPGGQPLTVHGTNIRYFSPFNSSNLQQNMNCYDKIAPVNSDGPILLRVTYQYINYDTLNSPPKFEMWVGTTSVATIDLSQKDPWTEEVIYSKPVSQDGRVFCLVALAGAPVVSYIELRPLPVASYQAANDTTMLRQTYRLDCGNRNHTVRFPDDLYDRIWGVDQSASSNSVPFASNSTLDETQVSESPPISVLETSRVLSSGTSLAYNLDVQAAGDYNVKLYFADLMNATNKTSFNVLINQNSQALVMLEGMIATEQDYSVLVDSAISITLQQLVNQPEINALELLQVIPAGPSSPNGDAMNSIAAYYGLTSQLDWARDPCLPVPWEGVKCTNSIVTSMDLSNQALERFSDLFTALTGLTYLNLSDTRMNSKIPDLTQLTKLQVLDLRDNNLFGTVNALAALGSSLTMLDLSNNPQLSGSIPASLNHSGLKLDTSGTCIGKNASCVTNSTPGGGPRRHPLRSSQKKSSRVPIFGGIVAAAVVALAGMGIFCFCMNRKRMAPSEHEVSSSEKGFGVHRMSTDLKNWQAGNKFTYKELAIATNNFEEPLGHGCFGAVYLGKLVDGQQVAVKMRSDDSQLGTDCFKNEVFLLSQVHHPNLVSLLGYCHDRRHQLLVYEYMAGGTLSDHLYGPKPRLNWVDRLQIAIDSATGIAYLHNEIDPKIIHRDVKSNNILLDRSMAAKVSDFGLSKLVLATDATHVTTIVKGTAGYLDPEYYETQQLTEKSDVYSFGVVLLELISGREPLSSDRDPEEYSLIAWAKPHLLAGSYLAIVDKTIKNTHNQKTLNMVCGLALGCVERRGVDRPSMQKVLRVLEDALAMEVQRRAMRSPSYNPMSTSSHTSPSNTVEPITSPPIHLSR